jgi:hypothetical protein
MNHRFGVGLSVVHGDNGATYGKGVRHDRWPRLLASRRQKRIGEECGECTSEGPGIASESYSTQPNAAVRRRAKRSAPVYSWMRARCPAGRERER